MALNAARLGNAIKGALVAAGGADNAAMMLLATGLANAIINEFKDNCEVDPTGVPPMMAGATAVTGKGKLT